MRLQRLPHICSGDVSRRAVCKAIGAVSLWSLGPASVAQTRQADTTPRPLVIGQEENPSQAAQVARALLAQAYARIRLPVVFQDLPLRRSLEMSKSGELDGELMRIAGLEADYPMLLPLRVPLGHFVVRAYAKDPALHASTWEALRQHRVVFVRGVLFLDRALEKQAQKVEVNSSVELGRALQAGMADIALAFETEDAAAQNLGDGVRRLPVVVQRIPLYHYLHERHAGLVPRLTDTLKTMFANGELSRLRKKMAAKAAR